MDTCILRPPNSQFLSDDVIGGVVLRAKQTERGLVANMDNQVGINTPSTMQRPTRWSMKRNSEPIGGERSPTDKRMKTQLALKEGASVMASQVVEHVLHEQQRLREMRRVRQIRYRKKKDAYANTLEDKNRELRQEIEKLHTRRRAALAAVPARESVWRVATEFFRLFRYGLRSSSSYEPSAQQEFLQHAMLPDVVFNAGRGPDAMAKSWKCLSMWFEDVQLELEEMHKGAAGSLIAATITSVTITERTLRNVFPHLLAEERALAKKLLNQRIVMRGIIRFEWHAAYDRVKSVLSQDDMLSPMLRLLENLEDVSRVFEKALISPDFQWRPRS